MKKNIITDRQIEARCNEMFSRYEGRILQIEAKLVTKCDEARVREIFREEQGKSSLSCSEDRIKEIVNEQATASGIHSVNLLNTPNQTQIQDPKVIIDSVMTAIDDRKAREGNIVIHKVNETMSANRDERKTHDLNEVIDILNACNV